MQKKQLNMVTHGNSHLLLLIKQQIKK